MIIIDFQIYSMQILTCSGQCKNVFFSIPVQETEQSTFNFVAVLDGTANKENVLKVLNILYENLEAWEVIWKHKVKAFLSYISDDFIPFQQYNF